MLRNQRLCCMSLHDHSSITVTIEMPDFDRLQRQFQTMLSRLLHRAPPNAGYGATSNPLQWLSPSSHNRMLAAERREATLLCPLRVLQRTGQLQATSSCRSVSCCVRHHCPTTAANQRQMHCAACHSPATFEGA